MTENHHKGKLKIIVAFSILFLVVSILLVLIFYAGKKTYVVTFDLNGGTLISGQLEQHITQGQNATPPTVVKDGAYLHSWSASPNHITKDMVITAVWNYETTKGIKYNVGGSQNYAEIAGVYQYIGGEVYLGSYYGDKMILGIGKNAFANCKGVTKVYLLDGLLSIGDNAFVNCTGLTEIEIPKTVVHLGSGTFRGCDSLETVILHEGLQEIGADAFAECSSLKEIVIPSTVTSIDESAFRGCTSLERVILSDNIEIIAPNTFKDCKALKNIVMPKKAIAIGESAFAGCESLDSVIMNKGLFQIGENAFEGCVALTDVTLPKSVTHLGKNVFAGCADLTVYIGIPQNEFPATWVPGWLGDAELRWVEFPEDEGEDTTEDTSEDAPAEKSLPNEAEND